MAEQEGTGRGTFGGWQRRRLSRRGFVTGALALGVAAPLAGGLLPSLAARPALAAPRRAPGKLLWVAGLNQELTRQEVAQKIQQEGKVAVANWTYTANDAIVGRFQQVVKQEYGVDVTCDYLPSQAPSVYLTNLYTASKAGNPAPYDVMAIEENYYFEAKANDVVMDILPSDLIPNAKLVDPRFIRGSQAIAFQATAFPAVIHTTDWFKEWTDLADPRLKGKVTIPVPGDITNGGHLIGLAWSMGKDYKNPEDMKAVVDFLVDKINPNVIKVTTDSAEMQQLLRSGAAQACCFWNSLARLEALSEQPGTENTKYTLASTGHPVINGYAWVPKGAQHPVLAQLFINWRISTDGMIPSDQWPTSASDPTPMNWQENKGPWAEIFEGVLYEEQEKAVPEWFLPYYQKYYPAFKDYGSLKAVDWEYYAAHQKEWQDYEAQRLGL